MFRYGRVAFLGLLVVVLASKQAFTQESTTTGAIVGTVKDEQGAVIVGATIVVRNLNSNLTRNTQINNQGAYFFSQLPPGKYEITINADGFHSKCENVVLNLGTTALLDITLDISSVLYEPEIVILESSLINQNKTESSTNIVEKSISNLPINRRDFINFALTSARVIKDPLPSQGSLTTSGLSINGQNARANNLTIDGFSNNEVGTGASLSTFSQEAVQEFQIVTDNFSAEIGRALAGTINIVTKSGSNDFHGNLFFIYRGNNTSARNAFSINNPKFRQYQFGSILGGPIKQNKAFFFASLERLSVKQNNIVTISDETTAAVKRQGFFQNNGAIPFSLANTGLLLKTDIIISSKNTLLIRYNSANTYNGSIEEFGGLIGDSAGGQLRGKDNSGAISNSYVNNNLVNESRIIFTRRDLNTSPISQQPEVQLIAPEGNIKLGRAAGLPQVTNQQSFQFINNTRLSYEKHSVKFGVDFFSARTLPPTTLLVFAGGSYSFSPINFSDLTGIPNLPSFNGLESLDPNLRSLEQKAFLNLFSANASILFPGFPKNVPIADLPIPLLFVQGFGDPNLSLKNYFFSSFVQDDIKLKPELTIKLGLRYDINRATSLTKNNGNFSPRLSFAYKPKKDINLYIRGAYGVFFGTPLGGISAFVQNYEKGLKTLVLTFPFSVLPLTLPNKTFPFSQALPQGVPFIPQLDIFGKVDSNFRNSYSQQTSLAVTFSPKNNTVISSEYIFVRGIKLSGVRDINPVINPLPNDPLGSFIEGRVDPSKGNIFNVESSYDSYYHALTFSINQKVQNKFSLLASYTYSKAIDNLTDFNPALVETNNSLKVGDERGLSLQDIRNRFVLSSIIDIGYSKSLFLKDLQFSSIITLESGKPYNLLTGIDLDLSGDAPPGDRPLGIGRNAGILPGFTSVDVRLIRTLKVNEKISVQTTFEAFNLFNNVNINAIDRLFPPDVKGKFNLPNQEKGRFVTPQERFRGASSPRQLQIGVKLIF